MRHAPQRGHSPGVVTREAFGTLASGRRASLFRLDAGTGSSVCVTDYGAAVTAVHVPDREGRLGNVVLGFDGAEGYEANTSYIGAVVGRYANRIAHGRFALGGKVVQIDTGPGEHALHGGAEGFDRRLWEGEAIQTPDGPGVILRLVSPHNDQGFPGRLSASVTYVWTPRDELVVSYRATSDRPTVVSLSQHSYFNLAGHGTVLDHELEVAADAYTPVTDDTLPRGEIRAVDGTAFDFRAPRRLGRAVGSDDPQVRQAGGIDHNFVLRRPAAGGLAQAARLFDPGTGRHLTVHTDKPGLQVFTGNVLGEDGASAYRPFERHGGIALETQHFPDAPNRPDFPSAVLDVGETYASTTVFAFGTDER